MTEVGADKLSAKTSNVIQSLLSQDISGVSLFSAVFFYNWIDVSLYFRVPSFQDERHPR